MITIAQIKKYLPDDIRVVTKGNNLFIGMFSNIHYIATDKNKSNARVTAFAINFSDEKEIPEELIQSRVNIAYQQGLKHELKMKELAAL